MNIFAALEKLDKGSTQPKYRYHVHDLSSILLLDQTPRYSSLMNV